MRPRTFLGSALLTALAAGLLLGGCTGDDPPARSALDEDASASDAAPQGDAEPSTGDGAAVTDGGGGDAEIDAGPPRWVDVVQVEGTEFPLATVQSATCKIDLFYKQRIDAVPPQYLLYLRKGDAAATCKEPKGVRMLATSYVGPRGRLLRPSARDLVVLAYTIKPSPSGSAKTPLTMSQVDWRSGNDLHEALMKTKAIPGAPVETSLLVEQLFFGDGTEEAAGTVRLKGSGAFPGETGSGDFFYAVYQGFLQPVPQPASAADTCAGGT
ncbi:MAG: hypothetical protein JWP97_4324 [Labilithrix sp.]|nr:hypothetical protein [Labilithrix sp.]